MPDTTGTRVLKFGGSCFLELSDYLAVARYLEGLLVDDESRVVAVVSGMSGSTGRLLEAARGIDPHLRPGVQDQVLATAEMLGASMLRAALDSLGCPATDLWAWQTGITSDSNATRAQIQTIDPGPLRAALREHRVVVVAGGQAVDARGRVTMLGRNSSDLSAVAVAAALSVDTCEILGDTPGVFTADPFVVPSAHLLPALSYDQCIAMSESGAKVLHWGAVRYARQHGVAVQSRGFADAVRGDESRGSLVGPATASGPAIVGDGRATCFRVRETDLPSLLAAARDANLLAHPLTRLEDAATVLAFPGGQSPESLLRSLGVWYEPLPDVSILTVVESDGSLVRTVVPREDLSAAVIEAHDSRYGAAVAAGSVPLATKTRSRHSDLLVGGS